MSFKVNDIVEINKRLYQLKNIGQSHYIFNDVISSKKKTVGLLNEKEIDKIKIINLKDANIKLYKYILNLKYIK